VSVVIGVDGGASRSRAVVLAAAPAEAPRELARAEGGAALVDPAAPSAAADAVASVVREAATRGGVELPVAGLVAALAGAGREGARAAVETCLRERGLAHAVSVTTDAEAARHDAFGTGPGVLVIAGTGSIVVGADADGRRVRVGGWGEVLGDPGSAHDLALRAVRAVAAADDGLGPSTRLTGELLGALGLERPEQLIAWLAGADKRAVAALAPRVAELAAAGDPVARRVVDAAGAALSDQLCAAVRRLAPGASAAGGRPGVALAGALLAPGGPLRERLERCVRGLDGVLAGPVDAARGAARMALDRLP
jgi:N-acetylglucosamine kinase-like BadF-type ATPase